MRLYCFPDYPNKEFYSLSLILQRLGWTVTLDEQQTFDAALSWQDTTIHKRPEKLHQLHSHYPVINLFCTDISKIQVNNINQQVFGYGSLLDPSTHQGACVEKPNANASYSGWITECPVDKINAEHVYQQVIISGEKEQIEYRVPVVLGVLPLAYEIRQPLYIEQIKQPQCRPPEIKTIDDLFSIKEQQQILQFCTTIGLDFGELDILRCLKTQRLYIIDANKTPGGYGLLNYFHWRSADKNNALDKLSKTFAEQIQQLINR